MNFLAHLYLARENEGVIIGALLEDYVVGNIENEVNSRLPEDVKKGLRLHRFIDSFTDTDLEVKDCKYLFYPDFGKYAPVITDVLFDHFLHKNWERLSKEPFEVFKNRIYGVLSTSYLNIQPPAMKKLVQSMLEYDWLPTFIEFWGLEKALSSLNRKVKQVDLTLAIDIMKANYDFINQKFLTFFERLEESIELEFFAHGQ